MQVTPRSVQSGTPTSLAFHSPTHGSYEFYLESSRKVALAARISLLQYPLQDNPYRTRQKITTAIDFARLSLQDQKTKTKPVLKMAELADRDADAATITLTAT